MVGWIFLPSSQGRDCGRDYVLEWLGGAKARGWMVGSLLDNENGVLDRLWEYIRALLGDPGERAGVVWGFLSREDDVADGWDSDIGLVVVRVEIWPWMPRELLDDDSPVTIGDTSWRRDTTCLD